MVTASTPMRPPSHGSGRLVRALSGQMDWCARLADGVNKGEDRNVILPRLLGDLMETGLAGGMVLTAKTWKEAPPMLVSERLEGVPVRWPDLQGEKERLDSAHAGNLPSWSVRCNGNEVDCFAFCFSTETRGAIALTAVLYRHPKRLLEVQKPFSPIIEALLIRDRLLQPGRPLRDMAEMTRATLVRARRCLAALAKHNGRVCGPSPERDTLLLRIRELRNYTHIEKHLAEVSAALVALVPEIEREPPSAGKLGALHDVFRRMAKIGLTAQDADWCINRLAAGGLDIFDLFGEGRRNGPER